MVLQTFYKQVKLEVKRNKIAYLFMLPAVGLLLLISLYPIFYAFSVSLHETKYLKVRDFVGFKNYVEIVNDPQFRRNVVNSFIYVGSSLVLAMPLGMLLALALNRKMELVTFFRTLLIIPWVISQTVSALLWSWLLNPSYGPVNYLLDVMGIGRVDFLTNARLSMTSVVLTNVWSSFPLPMILCLAALSTVPQDLYESAKIDGGGTWACFKYVTFPFISNTLMVAAILLTLHYFNMVTLIYVLTGGGPMRLTEVLSLRVFHEGFVYWHLAIASAAGIIIFFFNIIFSLAYIKVLRREALY